MLVTIMLLCRWMVACSFFVRSNPDGGHGGGYAELRVLGGGYHVRILDQWSMTAVFRVNFYSWSERTKRACCGFESCGLSPRSREGYVMRKV